VQKKAIITGMNGTVAPAAAAVLIENNIQVVPWDRNKVATDDETAIRSFIESERPDYFFHIAMGSPDWTEHLARICSVQDIPFLFTGTVSVFSEHGSGPYTIESEPNAEDDYGKYKRECEERIKAVNPKAYIARIGWQIGSDYNSNNMCAWLEKNMSEKGVVEASSLWYPSSSFLEDTADVLLKIITGYTLGLYLVNSNKKMNFFKLLQV